jgi:hypothetical protein
MIELTLLCHDGHRFNAWFPDTASFEAQNARGLVACPHCGSLQVSKGLQRPSVVGGRDRARSQDSAGPSQAATTVTPAHPAPQTSPAPSPQAAAPTAQQVAQMQAFISNMRRLQAYVQQSFDDVGNAFSEEARKIHYGEAEERGIYGQATGDEIEELLDEGIEIMPLPKLPELDS